MFANRFKLQQLTFLAGAMVILIVAFCVYWLSGFLFLFDDPSGANGYFYLKQTESLANGVGFYFKDRSLAFALLVLLYKILGNSLDAFRIGILIISSLITLGTATLYWTLSNGFNSKLRAFGLILTTTLVAVSFQLYEFELTYFKNAFALMLLIWSLVFFYRESRRSKLFASVLMVAALLSHKSMILLIGAFVIPAYLNRETLKSLPLRKIAIASLVGVVAITIFLWQFEKASAYLRALMNVFMSPHGWLKWARGLQWINRELLIGIVALWLTLIASLFVVRKLSPKHRSFIIGTILLSLVALNPFQLPGANGPGYRILILMPVFSWVALSLITTRTTRSLLFLPVSFVIGLQAFQSTKHFDDLFTPWSNMRGAVSRIPEFVTQADHLTSHHGLEFFVDYVTNIRSRSFLNNDPQKKEFRVAYVGMPWLRNLDLHSEIRSQAILPIGKDYMLVTEEKWQEILKEYDLKPNWKNPSIHRPDFIYE